MNVGKLEELVNRLAIKLENDGVLTILGELQSLEYFAYGAQDSSDNSNQVSDYILAQTNSIRKHLVEENIKEAEMEMVRLEGYVDRLAQEPVLYTTNGNANDTNQKLVYMASQKMVEIGNRKIPLNDEEAPLMKFLYSNQEEVHSIGEINQEVWKGTKKHPSTFWYTVNKLIDKIQSDDGPRYIQKFHGIGLMFSPDPSIFSFPDFQYDDSDGSLKIQTDENETQLVKNRKIAMDFLSKNPNTIHSTKKLLIAVYGEGTTRQQTAITRVMYDLMDVFTDVGPNVLSPIIGSPSKGYMLKI